MDNTVNAGNSGNKGFKIGIIIIVIAVVITGLWMFFNNGSSTGTQSPSTTPTDASQQNQMPDTTASGQTSATATTPSSNPSDTSNAAFDQDTSNIDAQMNGLSSDNQASQSTDTPVSTQ